MNVVYEIVAVAVVLFILFQMYSKFANSGSDDEQSFDSTSQYGDSGYDDQDS